MSKTPFGSVEHFRQTFSAGLQKLLHEDGLGAYILAHANAGFDAELMSVLRPRLLHRFQVLASECQTALKAGSEPNGAADDVSVFLKLMAIGFEGVAETRFRHLEPWELQFNLSLIHI